VLRWNDSSVLVAIGGLLTAFTKWPYEPNAW
jgi:hypothetical protein